MKLLKILFITLLILASTNQKCPENYKRVGKIPDLYISKRIEITNNLNKCLGKEGKKLKKKDLMYTGCFYNKITDLKFECCCNTIPYDIID